jgi:MATE family, multidrug efflux pump
LATVIGPFIGQNFGAKTFSRISEGVKVASIFALIWGFVSFALLAIFARPIALLFNKNSQITDNIISFLRIVPLGMGFHGLLIISCASFIALHKPLYASILVFFEMVLLYIPLGFLGSKLGGIPGLFMGLMIAYVIAGIIARRLFLSVFGKMSIENIVNTR